MNRTTLRAKLLLFALALFAVPATANAWWPPWRTAAGYYGWQSPYPYTGGKDPVGDLISQEANLLREQVYRSRSDTRMKIFDERRYYRENTPTYEEVRQAELKQRFSHAMNNPPLSSIRSGAALNDLATVIHNRESDSGARGPTVEIGREVTDRINWATDPNSAGVALIRDGSRKLKWPDLVMATQFQSQRKDIAKLLDEAIAAVRTQSPGAGRIVSVLQEKLEALRAEIRELRFDVASDTYLKAVGFFRQHADAVAALQKPGAHSMLGERIQAGTVADLLDQMNGRGLSIAAAVPGDEPAYKALYNAMSEYERGLTRSLSGASRSASRGGDKKRFE